MLDIMLSKIYCVPDESCDVGHNEAILILGVAVKHLSNMAVLDHNWRLAGGLNSRS